MLDNILKHRAELSRALANHHYERMPDGGLFFPRAGAIATGVFRTWLNGSDERIDPNMMMLVGLDDILKVYFQQSAQRTAFYIAPFSDNETPSNALTAATFPATLTEFINYAESARPVWDDADAVASQTAANTTTPARFTIGSGGGTVWGAALTTASAKSATSGLLVCASKFAAARTMLEGDKLDIEYAITAADGS